MSQCSSECKLTEMRSTTFFFVGLVVAAGRVAAQDDPTTANTTDGANATPTGIPACFLSCAGQVGQEANCADVTSVSCFCSSEYLRSAIKECITSNCNEEDQAVVSDFQLELCGNVDDPSGSLSPSVAPATASTTSSTQWWVSTPYGGADDNLGHPTMLDIPYTPIPSATAASPTTSSSAFTPTSTTTYFTTSATAASAATSSTAFTATSEPAYFTTFATGSTTVTANVPAKLSNADKSASPAGAKFCLVVSLVCFTLSVLI
ncbi:hypothetical protein M407DRAFT_25931 [Tulasnella calospora MUT 4182]|uniref:CFEM domain-containing protein n=1 Tax=Tulasnella calospora MUT 4182 TaxID=1051891 RepID=A0A0C3LTH4_9AGAM|nr:hypothetical protein M407DRAFT_25931 [Tulasnella calospora MUT 4182]